MENTDLCSTLWDFFVYLFNFVSYCCTIIHLHSVQTLLYSTSSSQVFAQSSTLTVMHKTDEFLGPVECLEKK